MRCHLGVIDLYFDNIGKYIIKNYRVSHEKTKTADIITTALQIAVDDQPKNNIQTKKELQPKRCRKEELTQIHEKMENHIANSNINFRKYRFNFVSNNECKTIYQSLKKKCGSAVVKNMETVVFKSPALTNINIDVGVDITREKRPLVKMAEPVMLNPNSYQNVRLIRDELKVSSEIGESRQWVFLGCDGPSHCLSERIINENVERYEFASMVPGLGHLHMNQMKTLFKVILENNLLLYSFY